MSTNIEIEQGDSLAGDKIEELLRTVEAEIQHLKEIAKEGSDEDPWDAISVVFRVNNSINKIFGIIEHLLQSHSDDSDYRNRISLLRATFNVERRAAWLRARTLMASKKDQSIIELEKFNKRISELFDIMIAIIESVKQFSKQESIDLSDGKKRLAEFEQEFATAESEAMDLLVKHGSFQHKGRLTALTRQFSNAMRLARNAMRKRGWEISRTTPAQSAGVTAEDLQEAVEKIEIFRGCEVIGGSFEYKVKIKNSSPFVITEIIVTIVAYPDDCLELVGPKIKRISRIEVGGFRSPSFVFIPTKDCVLGKIVASVSFNDATDKVHVLPVREYVIRSVCDLLRPKEMVTQQLDTILSDMVSDQRETTVPWNAEFAFTKTRQLLAANNFHIVDETTRDAGGQFVGVIRGFAEGKYTKKRVVAVITIAGTVDKNECLVTVEAMGDDIAMLPTTIEELSEGITTWSCIACGHPLDADDVVLLKTGVAVACPYCGTVLKRDQYVRE
ncbi:MAG: zinc ribbon domain-containing protein [Candidatus Thorarchaeota archaeon]|nr:zinc ribbon domain-containing protein [Candidatus Thorarchaeota archaeon]